MKQLKAILTKDKDNRVVEIEILFKGKIVFRYKAIDRSYSNDKHLLICKQGFIQECHRLNRFDILECLK